MSYEDIKKIAQHTRAWAMRNRCWSKNGRVVDDNGVYSYFPKDLCGMCGIAAARLFTNLQDAGYQPQLAMRNSSYDGHCFVIVDGFIVDVTATQFGLKPVEIVPLLPKPKRPIFWRETSLFDSVQQLVVRQKRSGWPDDQIAQADK